MKRSLFTLLVFLLIEHITTGQAEAYFKPFSNNVFNYSQTADLDDHSKKISPRHIYVTSAPRSYQRKTSAGTQAKFKKTSFVAKVNGYNIAYDLYYPNKDDEDEADSVVIYAKKGKAKTILLSEPLDALYLDEVSVKYFCNHPFIYFATGTTHGDTYGEIYSFNSPLIQLERIDKLPLPAQAKAPKGYYQNKNYGIRIEENDRIYDGIIYRNDDNGDLGYTIDVEYKMIKTGNSYKLKPIRQTISK